MNCLCDLLKQTKEQELSSKAHYELIKKCKEDKNIAKTVLNECKELKKLTLKEIEEHGKIISLDKFNSQVLAHNTEIFSKIKLSIDSETTTFFNNDLAIDGGLS